ncbi:MAG: OmpP1/FadL family transporter [Hyphomicrobiaceae bacterium]
MNKISRTLLAATAIGAIGFVSAAHAGGFAIREQSTSSQGASFAGNAAGGDLSSMFWNPAALAASEGMNAESHYAIFFGNTELEADGGSLLLVNPTASRSSGDIAEEAVIPSTYLGAQLSSNLWAGLALNSPFGLVTKPEDRTWVGAQIARRTKVFTINANPNIAYQIMPGVSIGAGVQIQYMEAELKLGTSAAGPSAVFNGDDIGFGGTFGVYFNPVEGTQIGIGYRSQISHTLEGNLGIEGGPVQARNNVDLTTPDTITVSLRQAVTPQMRVMATFEWANWADFDQVVLTDLTSIGLPPGTTGTLEANWHNAWFASIGAEFDMSDVLTVRGGIAYEESPIQNASERLTPVPDSDRIWVSVGGTYRFSEHTKFDFAYTHVFVDEARFDRTSIVSNLLTLQGTAETDVNIVSFSLKSKLDENHPIFGTLFQ